MGDITLILANRNRQRGFELKFMSTITAVTLTFILRSECVTLRTTWFCVIWEQRNPSLIIWTGVLECYIYLNSSVELLMGPPE